MDGVHSFCEAFKAPATLGAMLVGENTGILRQGCPQVVRNLEAVRDELKDNFNTILIVFYLFSQILRLT